MYRDPDSKISFKSLKYNEYIEKYVKGVVEDYIDGNAVSRVRKLLTANNQIKF